MNDLVLETISAVALNKNAPLSNRLIVIRALLNVIEQEKRKDEPNQSGGIE